jgi:protein disulfide-isomerase-like protein
MKSETVPTEATVDGVTTLVAKNFETTTKGKNSLIKFYAPWCGHCKALAPKWDQLGKQLESKEDVVVAKFDATANDVPGGFDVRGFPTIYYQAADGTTEQYQGGREVNDFVQYLRSKNAISDSDADL